MVWWILLALALLGSKYKKSSQKSDRQLLLHPYLTISRKSLLGKKLPAIDFFLTLNLVSFIILKTQVAEILTKTCWKTLEVCSNSGKFRICSTFSDILRFGEVKSWDVHIYRTMTLIFLTSVMKTWKSWKAVSQY